VSSSSGKLREKQGSTWKAGNGQPARTGFGGDIPLGLSTKNGQNNSNLALNNRYGGWKVSGNEIER
jgi:hypothetical protein